MTAARMVQLIDGRFVQSDAEEWRHETLAAQVLAIPALDDRRLWLAGFEKKHGKADADALRETMLQLHKAKM